MAALIAVIAVMSLHSGAAISASTYEEWGKETLAEIQKDFYNPSSGTYSDSAKASGKSGRASCWTAGVMFSALNAAAGCDPSQYKAQLLQYAASMQDYLNSAGPVPGYDASAHPGSPDRYYDDNAWLVRDFADAYTVTMDPLCLRGAETAAAFVWSGWDLKLGGGIYWHEQNKNSKNTCSNGPSADGFLKLAYLTPNSEYLTHAQDCWGWAKSKLRDPADGLYWDNISLDGKVSKTKWSYNTALMLEAGWILAKKHPSLEDGLNQTLASSLKKWHDADGSIADGASFAHLLVEAWLQTPSDSPEAKEARADALEGIQWLHANCRDSNGRYGNLWNQKVDKPLTEWTLMASASAARAYFLAAAAVRDSG